MEALSRLSIILILTMTVFSLLITPTLLACRVSQLHLIKWSHQIIDVGVASFLRAGSNKGDAIRYILAGRKTACFLSSFEEDEEETKELSKRMGTLRNVLGVHSTVPTSFIRFDLH